VAVDARSAPDVAELLESLRGLGLVRPDEQPTVTRLSGGVSSDVWRVDLSTGPVCVKHPLAKLQVESDWFAPVRRWRSEVAWLRVAHEVVPDAVPRVLGVDEARDQFVMEYFPGETHVSWKAALLQGDVDPTVAAAVGDVVGTVHATTAHRREIASQFDTEDLFAALRLEPYFETTKARHPDLAEGLQHLVDTTTRERHVLVHGDVSPKNVLVRRSRPVLLDAECASYGDPAFDLAFCVSHLLLKSTVVRGAAPSLQSCVERLVASYGEHVTWEQFDSVDARAAALVAGLLLARVDGRSPVDYLTDADRERVRRAARELLTSPREGIADVCDVWFGEVIDAG
jgi:aminoglycoside phosphotransferase (APT) family kinase protein